MPLSHVVRLISKGYITSGQRYAVSLLWGFCYFLVDLLWITFSIRPIKLLPDCLRWLKEHSDEERTIKSLFHIYIGDDLSFWIFGVQEDPPKTQATKNRSHNAIRNS